MPLRRESGRLQASLHPTENVDRTENKTLVRYSKDKNDLLGQIQRKHSWLIFFL